MQSREEIINKAIGKAIGSGWKPFPFTQPYLKCSLHERPFITELTLHFEAGVELKQDWRQSLDSTIFSHKFAKALWGDEENTGWLPEPDFRTGDTFVPALYYGPVWKYHLMMMVIADDPIAYLGENL